MDCTDFVETRVEIPDAANKQSRIKAEKGKGIGYYRVLQKRRYRWIKIAAGLGTMGFVGSLCLVFILENYPRITVRKNLPISW